ncbi:unnamed protein product [Brassica oleracea var. botrytis]
MNIFEIVIRELNIYEIVSSERWICLQRDQSDNQKTDRESNVSKSIHQIRKERLLFHGYSKEVHGHSQEVVKSPVSPTRLRNIDPTLRY